MAMKRIDIVKSPAGWTAKSDGREVVSGSRKDELVRQVAQSARASGQPTSVRIHSMNGTIQEERTYPRGADPRWSRG
jgi:hypothetical protein